MIKVSIIIRTLGRPTLRELLESIKAQPLREGDEVMVFGETEDGAGKAIVSEFPEQFQYICYPTPKGSWGQPAINYGISIARGDYINVQDDDDKMAAGILDKIRELAEKNPGKILMFDMLWPNGYITPGPSKDPVATGGASIVVPNIKGRIGFWPSHISGDYDFMKDTIAMHPEGKNGVVFRSEIITLYAGKHCCAGKP